MSKKNEENSILKERILEYAKYKGIKNNEIYQNSGISEGILSQRNGLTEGNLLRFLNFYADISPDWLLTGTGPMLRDPEKQKVQENTQHTTLLSSQSIEDQRKDTKNSSLVKDNTSEGIPLIPVEAMAGFANGDVQVMEYDIIDRYNIPDFENRGIKYLIRVSGSSMYPKYSNGDLLACRPINDTTFIQWGKVYVLDTDQGPLVKRLFECDGDGDCLECRSDNKDHYPPFKIYKSSIRRVAIVVGVIRLES